MKKFKGSMCFDGVWLAYCQDGIIWLVALIRKIAGSLILYC